MFRENFSLIGYSYRFRMPVEPALHMNSPQTPAAHAPAHLLPVCASAAQLERIRPLLSAAGLDGPQDDSGAPDRPAALVDKDIGDFSDLPDWVAASPQAHLLVFVPVPTLDIARRLGKECPPRQALAQWLDEADKVLCLVRACRRRCSVFFIEAALSNPRAFVQALAQRLQLSLEYQPSPSRESVPGGSAENFSPSLPGAVLRMLAENTLWQSAEARNVASELEATALPVPASPDFLLPAADQVFAEYRKTVDTPAQMARELREENKLLLDQLQRVQQKMEAFTAEKLNIETRLSSAEQYKTDLEETRRQLEALKSQEQSSPKLRDLEEENELLLHQLHHVQEELERYYLKSQDTDQQLDQTRHELAHVHEELHIARSAIDALYSSKSWKVTRPMRAILDFFSGGSKQQPKA